MSLLTLFSAPKPFTDRHIATIQNNAIASWTHLPEVKVLLIGDEPGLAKAAREFNVKNLPDVERNLNHTPLISSMFRLARENSDSPLLGIVNADMILLPGFVEAVWQAVRLKDKFVLLSRRWDLDLREPLEFTEGWPDRLASRVRKEGTLHRPSGSDLFIFPRSCYLEVPEFAIGRAGWDNWMIYNARREKWPVIDCTPSAMIIHQNHDYGHLPGGRAHYGHPETDENIIRAGGQAAVRYTILDATPCLVDGKLVRPPLSVPRFLRTVELFLRVVFFFLPERSIENLVRPKRWGKRLRKLFK